MQAVALIGALLLVGCGRLSFQRASDDGGGTSDGFGVEDARSSVDGDTMIDAAALTDAPGCTLGPWQPPVEVTELNTMDWDGAPELRADGLEIVFARGTLDARDLYHARRNSTSEPFGAAVAMSALNTTSKDSGPSLSRDGLTLYFSSDGGGATRLYRATRASSGLEFTNPMVLSGGPFDECGDPSISTDELSLYTGDSLGNLKVATRTSTQDPFGAPVALGAPVASASWQEDVAISSDGLELYYVQDVGSSEFTIYVATRPDTSAAFGTAKPMPELAGGDPEWDPALSVDGKTFYFTRWIGAPGSNIWMMQRACLQ